MWGKIACVTVLASVYSVRHYPNHLWFLTYFLMIFFFDVDYLKKLLLNLLQGFFFFFFFSPGLVFWPWGGSPARDGTHTPTLEGEVFTTGAPGKAHLWIFKCYPSPCIYQVGTGISPTLQQRAFSTVEFRSWPYMLLATRLCCLPKYDWSKGTLFNIERWWTRSDRAGPCLQCRWSLHQSNGS